MDLRRESDAFRVSVAFKGIALVLRDLSEGEGLDEACGLHSVGRKNFDWFADLVSGIDWDSDYPSSDNSLCVLATSLRPSLIGGFERRGYDFGELFRKMYWDFVSGFRERGLSRKELADVGEVLEGVSDRILTNLQNSQDYSTY